MNNKGFAITTILYGTMILFLMLILAMLGILSSYKDKMDLLIESERGARTIINFVEIGEFKLDVKPKSFENRASYTIDENDMSVEVKPASNLPDGDAYTFIPYYVYLKPGKLYVFDCNVNFETNEKWGYRERVEGFLMYNSHEWPEKHPNEYVHLDSNSYFYFTVPTEGEYTLRLDINNSDESKIFSNIKVLGLKYS